MIRFVLVVLLFAALVYVVVRRLDAGSVRPKQFKQSDQPGPRRTVAPDDDEQFLRDLGRKQPPTE